MQDEEQRRQAIQNTFNTVAPDYGLGASRFFHLSGEIMAGLLDLAGGEFVLGRLGAGGGAPEVEWNEYRLPESPKPV